jgi:hypothetical protein
MNVKNDDLRILLLGIFRYSLGRRSYMPGYAVEMIKRYQKSLLKEDWKQFVDEIESFKSSGCLGEACDIQTWINFKEYCLEQTESSESKDLKQDNKPMTRLRLHGTDAVWRK